MFVYMLFTDDFMCLKFPVSAYTLLGFIERRIYLLMCDCMIKVNTVLHTLKDSNLYISKTFRFYECMQVLSDNNTINNKSIFYLK